jgi:hypothetical protein
VLIRHWFLENKPGENAYQWDNNKLVATWLQEQKDNNKSVIHKKLEQLRKETLTLQIQASLEVTKKHSKMFTNANLPQFSSLSFSSFQQNPDTVLDAVVGLCNNIPPQNRREVIHLLTQLALEKFEEKFGHE